MLGNTSVVIVDDHMSVSTSIAKCLELDGYSILAILDNAGALLPACEISIPAIVLMGIKMPGADPFFTVEQLLARFPDIKVIFFTGYPTDHNIDQAISCNAAGIVSKSESFDKLIEAIQETTKGNKYYSPLVDDRLITLRGKTPISRFASLTPRELEVLRYLAQGFTCRSVGLKLNLSPKTVEKHQYRIREKLRVNNAVELTRFSIREGIIEP